MSARKMVVFSTCEKEVPAASSTALRLRSAWSAWAAVPPSTSLPVPGSLPSWPAVKTRPPLTIAWLYGPMLPGAASVWTGKRGLMRAPSSDCDGFDASRFRPQPGPDRVDFGSLQARRDGVGAFRIVEDREQGRSAAGQSWFDAGNRQGSDQLVELRPQATGGR